MKRIVAFAIIAGLLSPCACTQEDTARAETPVPFNPESEPAGYTHWPAYELTRPRGVEYLAPSGPVRRAIEFRVADLNDAWNNINDNGTDTQSQLLRAMGMLQLGMYWDETFSDGILSGRVTAEDGDHFFDIGFTDASKSKIRLIQIAVDEGGQPLEGAAAEARRTPGTSTMASLLRPVAEQARVSQTQAKTNKAKAGRYDVPSTIEEILGLILAEGSRSSKRVISLASTGRSTRSNRFRPKDGAEIWRHNLRRCCSQNRRALPDRKYRETGLERR